MSSGTSSFSSSNGLLNSHLWLLQAKAYISSYTWTIRLQREPIQIANNQGTEMSVDGIQHRRGIFLPGERDLLDSVTAKEINPVNKVVWTSRPWSLSLSDI